MKNYNKFHIIICLFLLLLYACDSSKQGAKISSDVVEYDFGEIKRYSDGMHVFKIKNEGNKPLILTKVSSSCGCTTLSWTNKPIESENYGYVKVKYNTETLGEFHKTVVVRSNAVNSATYILKIKGKVVE